MVVDLATALDEFSTSLPKANARPLHSNAIVTESASLPADVVVSYAFVFVAVVLSMQIRYREYPKETKRKAMKKLVENVTYNLS